MNDTLLRPDPQSPILMKENPGSIDTMRTFLAKALAPSERTGLTQRLALQGEDLDKDVQKLLHSVRDRGDAAVREYAERFDRRSPDALFARKEDIKCAKTRISEDLLDALMKAKENIELFHQARRTPNPEPIETMPGVMCWAESRPIDRVGLYIPGGTAPLVSTVLMLGVPAALAGCREVVLATPCGKDGRVPDAILAAADLCGIERILQVGGVQAIAALGYGTETVPKVDKIFGPGNAYVTAAKRLIAMEPSGPGIDLVAGPSEVLVIADNQAQPSYVASDLLAQAEHGEDSRAILVCLSEDFADAVKVEIALQLEALPRKAIAQAAVENSFVLIVDELAEAFDFSNEYAPEHLIINVCEPRRFLSRINSAGSVFVGPWSCESAGDYASGTNHVLPTEGKARYASGVSVRDFEKVLTFQELDQIGVESLLPIVTTLAEAEGLLAHRNALWKRVGRS